MRTSRDGIYKCVYKLGLSGVEHFRYIDAMSSEAARNYAKGGERSYDDKSKAPIDRARLVSVRWLGDRHSVDVLSLPKCSAPLPMDWPTK